MWKKWKKSSRKKCKECISTNGYRSDNSKSCISPVCLYTIEKYLKCSQIYRDTAQLFKSWTYLKESFCSSFKTSRPPACSEMGCSKVSCKWLLPGTLLHCYDNSQTVVVAVPPHTHVSYTFYCSLWNSKTEAPSCSVLSQRGVMCHKRGHNFAPFLTRNVWINVYPLQTVFPWSTVQWNDKRSWYAYVNEKKPSLRHLMSLKLKCEHYTPAMHHFEPHNNNWQFCVVFFNHFLV